MQKKNLIKKNWGNIQSQKICWSEKNLGPKWFWVQKTFGFKNIFCPKNFGLAKFLLQKNYYAKNCYSKKLFGQNKIWPKKLFWSKIILGQNFFGSNKIFGAKNMLGQKIWVKNYSGSQKIFGPKNWPRVGGGGECVQTFGYSSLTYMKPKYLILDKLKFLTNIFLNKHFWCIDLSNKIKITVTFIRATFVQMTNWNKLNLIFNCTKTLSLSEVWHSWP